MEHWQNLCYRLKSLSIVLAPSVYMEDIANIVYYIFQYYIQQYHDESFQHLC